MKPQEQTETRIFFQGLKRLCSATPAFSVKRHKATRTLILFIVKFLLFAQLLIVLALFVRYDPECELVCINTGQLNGPMFYPHSFS
jgi:hypothetical protein